MVNFAIIFDNLNKNWDVPKTLSEKLDNVIFVDNKQNIIFCPPETNVVFYDDELKGSTIKTIIEQFSALKYECILVCDMNIELDNVKAINYERVDTVETLFLKLKLLNDNINWVDDVKSGVCIPDEPKYNLLRKMNWFVCKSYTRFDANEYTLENVSKRMKVFFEKKHDTGSQANYYGQLCDFLQYVDNFPYEIYEQFKSHRQELSVKYRTSLEEKYGDEMMNNDEFQIKIDKFIENQKKCKNINLLIVSEYLLSIEYDQPDMLKIRFEEFINTSLTDDKSEYYLDLNTGIWKFGNKTIKVSEEFCSYVKSFQTKKIKKYEFLVCRTDMKKFPNTSFLSREFKDKFEVTYSDMIVSITKNMKYNNESDNKK